MATLKRKIFPILFFFGLVFCSFGQDIKLLEQFNGRYDFTFIGNTMNLAENNLIDFYITGTSSSATLNLSAENTIVKAYLYWAGSGDGDFNVKLNSEEILADRTFSLTKIPVDIPFTYFSAFKDITNQIKTTGNGTYILSDLDISPYEALHFTRKTNFAGWAILIIYQNDNLPLNQLNIYDGLQGVPDSLSITLNNLYVIDNNKSKVGFIAWEGDNNLTTEEFKFNGKILSNASNPSNNVFNGTNSITGSNSLYNMDLDIYDIDNYINIGDTSAGITLTSYQDFVMISTVVTKFNSQLPDATIAVTSVEKECDSKTITVNYTVSNVNSTDPLPAQTPIAIYADGTLIASTATETEIPIGETISLQITLILPEEVLENLELKFVVDDTGDGTGIVTELNETNNVFIQNESLWLSPKFNPLPILFSCNEGFGKATFDFSEYEVLVKVKSTVMVSFYENNEDATLKTNPIINTFNYSTSNTPKEIFVRIDNEYCFSITSFLIKTKNCPPKVYNYISANNDTYNDTFHIEGLYNIFINFKLEIYNRWGRLLWTGNNYTPEWNGYVKDGLGTKTAPDGTYFYLLYLNDPDYYEPLQGYLYLNH